LRIVSFHVFWPRATLSHHCWLFSSVLGVGIYITESSFLLKWAPIEYSRTRQGVWFWLFPFPPRNSCKPYSGAFSSRLKRDWRRTSGHNAILATVSCC
jgi:hypothetical protein